jgi:predicted RND superfamily exporter protein
MRRLAALVTGWPRAVVAASLVLAALGAWLGAFQLKIDSDTDSLIAPERPFMVGYRAFLKEFGDLEGIVIAVDPKGNDAAARAAMDDIEELLDSMINGASRRGRRATRNSRPWRPMRVRSQMSRAAMSRRIP